MRPWTTGEEEALRVLAPLGGRACAAALERSLKSVERRAARLGVSLRRRTKGGNPGVGCGEAVLKRVRELALAPLCPACGKRPVGVRATGLCAVCHLESLRTAHEIEIAKADAQRALWAARSKLRRRRRELAASFAAPAARTGDSCATMEDDHLSRPERTDDAQSPERQP